MADFTCDFIERFNRAFRKKQYYLEVREGVLDFGEVPFNQDKRGINARLAEDGKLAARINGQYDGALVFSSLPITREHCMAVQVVSSTGMYSGVMQVGFMLQDPDMMPNRQFYTIDDIKTDLDRAKYCIVQEPDIKKGNIIFLWISGKGDVMIKLGPHGSPRLVYPSVVPFEVKSSTHIWPFVNIFGSTEAVKMFASHYYYLVREGPLLPDGPPPTGRIPNITPEIEAAVRSLVFSTGRRNIENTESCDTLEVGNDALHSPYVASNTQVSNMSERTSNVAQRPDDGTCAICLENPVQVVLYECGHFVLCDSCADQLKSRLEDRRCPICRQFVYDFVHVFRSSNTSS